MHVGLNISECIMSAQFPLLCRLLDAGNNETLCTLSEPASKKRQGAKSREVGQRLSSERYGV